MSDLISRSELLAKIGNVRRVTEYDETGCGMEYSALPEWAVMLAPAVDAAPVVHGRWLTSSDIPDTLICSVCGRRFDMYHFDQKDMPFCLCGAKMDGGA